MQRQMDQQESPAKAHVVGRFGIAGGQVGEGGIVDTEDESCATQCRMPEDAAKLRQPMPADEFHRYLGFAAQRWTYSRAVQVANS